MEYTYLTLAVMAGSLAAAWWQGAVRERAFWLALAAFGVVTLVADVVLTAIPVYAYAERSAAGSTCTACRWRTSATGSRWPASPSSSGGRSGTAREALRRAVVVGAGLGGLAAALRLRGARARGDRRRARRRRRAGAPGGIVERGYTWDTGPSLITMPWLLRRAAGARGPRPRRGADPAAARSLLPHRLARGRRAAGLRRRPRAAARRRRGALAGGRREPRRVPRGLARHPRAGGAGRRPARVRGAGRLRAPPADHAAPAAPPVRWPASAAASSPSRTCTRR